MIRKCIGCLVCLNEIFHHRHVKCSVNPTTGREREFARPERNGAGRIIAVIGGGPAGLTAALVLKEQGFPSRPVRRRPAPGRHPQCRRQGDRQGQDHPLHRLHGRPGPRDRHRSAPRRGGDGRQGSGPVTQRVFIACGARPFIPPVPGIDGGNVVLAEEVLLHPEEAKGDCVIIGSGMTGLETAEVVLKSGHRTTIADLLPEIGAGR